MKTESSKCRRESEDKQMDRKRKKVDWFVFLPDVFLRYKAKYVCTRWFNIITNRILLDHASCILQNLLTFKTRVVDIMEKEEGLRVKEQDLDMPHQGRIRCWCNEFVLMSNHNNLYVYNVITKEGSYLPECTASCGGHDTSKCAVGLSFDRFKGIYKVVHLFMGPPIQCEIRVWRSDIVTPVSQKWKMFKVSYTGKGQYFKGDPVLVDGRYLHWDVINSNYMISMDIVKEEIFQMKLPGSGYHSRFVLSSFVMCGKLAKIEKVSSEKAEIWILKDFEKKKWEKLHSVNVKNFLEIERYPGDLYPVCGVISKRCIILESRPVKRLFSYDLKDGVVKEIDHGASYDQCVILTSSPSFI